MDTHYLIMYANTIIILFTGKDNFNWTDGSAIIYNGWFTYAPNENSASLAGRFRYESGIGDYLWDDQVMTLLYGYICEKQAGYTFLQL